MFKRLRQVMFLHRNRPGLFVTVLVLLLTLGTSAVHAADTAQDVLAACDQSLRAARTWSMQVSIQSSGVASPAVPRVTGGISEYQGTYVRDGARLDVQITLIANPVRAGASRVGTRQRAIVNGYFLGYTKSPEGRMERGVLFALNGHRFSWHALSLMDAAAMEGWLADPEPVTEILRGCADLRAADQTEEIDGQPCVVISGTSKYGKYSLWCDQKIGYLPRKISAIKSGSDIRGNTTVEKERLYAPGGNGALMAPSRIEITADSITFQTVEGITLPVSCRNVTRTEFANGGWHERRVVVKRDKIDLHPDLTKPGLFEPDMPDGTILSNQEDLRSPYEWRDGKPVPSTRNRLAAATRPSGDDTVSLTGKPAPAFSLPTLDGGKVQLSDQNGKVVVLDFWATWCPPCRKSLPHVQELSTDPDRAKSGLIVWLIDDKEDDATVRKFLKDNGYNFTIPMDYVGEALAKYLVRGIPTTVIVGRDGVIQKVFVGYGTDTGKAIDAAVDAALKSEPSS